MLCFFIEPYNNYFFNFKNINFKKQHHLIFILLCIPFHIKLHFLHSYFIFAFQSKNCSSLKYNMTLYIKLFSYKKKTKTIGSHIIILLLAIVPNLLLKNTFRFFFPKSHHTLHYFF